MKSEDSIVKEDDYLVRVKAQVMTRDESTGGWVPLGRGGMSIVGLRRLVTAVGDDITAEYMLHGQRIADQSVVLNCVLKKDLQYVKANPTFHHWWTEDKRFGLTFQSSAESRVLERSVRKALETMLTPPDTTILDSQMDDDEVFVGTDLPLGREDSWSQSVSTASTAASSPSPQSPVNLYPSTNLSPPIKSRVAPFGRHPLQQVPFVSRPRARSPTTTASSTPTRTPARVDRDKITVEDVYDLRCDLKSDRAGRAFNDGDIEMVDYSYVQLATKHDYIYPTLDPISKAPSLPSTSSLVVTATSSRPSPQQRYSSMSSLRRGGTTTTAVVASYAESSLSQPPVPLPIKSRSKRKDILRKPASSTTGATNRRLVSPRARCIYCHEMFARDENCRGSCGDAPDAVARCIDRASCICCARAVLYHCVADAGSAGDIDYQHPCVCDASSNAASNGRRWTALAILSLVVPCLWCYLPLTGCYRCSAKCGCCGGRHKTA